MPDTAEATHDVVNDSDQFRLSLDNFEGPFDLLLNLIGKHELDVTEIALSLVTTEFLAYLKNVDSAEELEKTSEFLVVAATLIDMKVVGLLPGGELVDAEDAAVLEARDLLFARLLQYRAFKEASAWFDEQLKTESNRNPRLVRLDTKYVDRAPELVWNYSVEDFAAFATLAFSPKILPVLGLSHLHAPLVSIREQAGEVVNMLRQKNTMNFRELIAGIQEPGIVIARFLAVLELYRNNALDFDQTEPLGTLTLHWLGTEFGDEQLANLGADYDNG